MNGKDYYTEYYKAHKRDLVLIGNMIDEHNFYVTLDKKTGYFKRKPTKVSFQNCTKKSCKICNEIAAAGQLVDEVPNARIISRGVEKATLYSIARLLGRGYTIAEVAYLYQVNEQDVIDIAQAEIARDLLSIKTLWRLFYDFFEVDYDTIFKIIPYTPEDVRRFVRIDKDKLEGFENCD